MNPQQSNTVSVKAEPPKAESPKSGWDGFTRSVIEKVAVAIVVAAILAIPFTEGIKYVVDKFGPAPQVPIGTIVAWDGRGQLPDGWAICNGRNGTPNLDDLFLRGVTDVIKAGSTTNSHTTMVHETLKEGGNKVGAIRFEQAWGSVVPKHYTVVYIMRIH